MFTVHRVTVGESQYNINPYVYNPIILYCLFLGCHARLPGFIGAEYSIYIVHCTI